MRSKSPQKERALSEVYPFIISSCCICGKGGGGGVGWAGAGLHRDLRGCAPILGSGPFGQGPISRSTPPLRHPASPPPQLAPPRPPGCAYMGSRVTFSLKMLLLRGIQWGIQKSTLEPPTPRGTRVMAARSFNFNGKPKGRPTQNRDVPRFLALFQF